MYITHFVFDNVTLNRGSISFDLSCIDQKVYYTENLALTGHIHQSKKCVYVQLRFTLLEVTYAKYWDAMNCLKVFFKLIFIIEIGTCTYLVRFLYSVHRFANNTPKVIFKSSSNSQKLM